MSKSKQTSLKKEKESRKRNKRKAKEEKREVRKMNSNKGKGFESMLAYVDEFGNLSDTPPDPTKRKEIKLEDIQLGARRPDERTEAEYVNKGRVSYYNEEKGYGFIKDSRTKESLFFHLNNVKTPVRQNDVVTFDITNGPKGPTATAVTKIE
jgi:cold shock CspA family protein